GNPTNTGQDLFDGVTNYKQAVDLLNVAKSLPKSIAAARKFIADYGIDKLKKLLGKNLADEKTPEDEILKALNGIQDRLMAQRGYDVYIEFKYELCEDCTCSNPLWNFFDEPYEWVEHTGYYQCTSGDATNPSWGGPNDPFGSGDLKKCYEEGKKKAQSDPKGFIKSVVK
ncbi:hypothetical protein BVX99_00345, partial [bacterium F16]